jgi:hypothetical protein
MKRIPLTRQLAWAAATDAGNRNMRRAGRRKWSLKDYNAATREFNRLWPLEREIERLWPSDSLTEGTIQ